MHEQRIRTCLFQESFELLLNRYKSQDEFIVINRSLHSVDIRNLMVVIVMMVAMMVMEPTSFLNVSTTEDVS